MKGVNMKTPHKYPSTPHWPHSQTVHRDDSMHKYASHFLNRPIIITEKLDGGNTCLYNGEVFARSVVAPSTAGWMAMVKKHHAWKIPGVIRDMSDRISNETEFYGEDIYGVHSIEYAEVSEDETFYLFAIRHGDYFFSWNEIESLAYHLGVNTVPVIYRGTVETEEELTKILEGQLVEPSHIGGAREGFVIRVAEEFPASTFDLNVCKYVRPGHVQTDEHWTRNWQPCKIKR